MILSISCKISESLGAKYLKPVTTIYYTKYNNNNKYTLIKNPIETPTIEENQNVGIANKESIVLLGSPSKDAAIYKTI